MSISHEELKFNFGCASCGYKSETEPTGKVDIRRFIAVLDGYFDKNDMDGAGRHIEYWMKEAARIRDRKAELSICDEAMGYYRKIADREKAYKAVDRSLELMSEMNLAESVTGATVMLNAATVYKSFGESKKALAYYESAERIYASELEEKDSRRAGLYNNTALALEDLFEYDRAEILYRKAIEITENLPDGKPDAAISYINMATMFGKMDDKTGYDIMDCMEEAIKLLDSEENTHNGYYFYVLSKCIPSLYEMGYANEAENYQRQVDGYYERS